MHTPTNRYSTLPSATAPRGTPTKIAEDFVRCRRAELRAHVRRGPRSRRAHHPVLTANDRAPEEVQ